MIWYINCMCIKIMLFLILFDKHSNSIQAVHFPDVYRHNDLKQQKYIIIIIRSNIMTIIKNWTTQVNLLEPSDFTVSCSQLKNALAFQ